MKKFAEDTKETEKLTDAIRKLGTPYVSGEPDQVYWANFRVRVMDRIAEGETKKVAFPERIREFIMGHVLGTSISAATLAILVTVAVIVKPFGSAQSPEMAVIAPPVAHVQTAPPQLAQDTEPAKAPAIAYAPAHSAPVHPIAKKSEVDMAALNQPENVSDADIQVLGASDADHPASLDELSQPELERLLKNMEDTE